MRVLALVLASLSCSPTLGDVTAPVDAGTPVVFARDIRPLINQSCGKCHFPGVQLHMGFDVTRLDLSTLGGLRRGGIDTRFDIVVPYAPEGSALVQKLRGTFAIGQRMPRNGPYWSESNIELVERWIAQGAKGDDSE
jgi:hypothetical protein